MRTWLSVPGVCVEEKPERKCSSHSFSQGSQQKGRDLEERGGGRVASVDREDEERVQQTVIREHLVGRQFDLGVIVQEGSPIIENQSDREPGKRVFYLLRYIHIYMQNKSRPNSRKILV